MIIVRLPTTLCVRRDPKFEVRSSGFEVPDTSAFGLQSSDRLTCLAFRAFFAMGAWI